MPSSRILAGVAVIMLGFCVIYVITRMMLLERRIAALQAAEESNIMLREPGGDISAETVNHMIKQQLEEAIDIALRAQTSSEPVEPKSTEPRFYARPAAPPRASAMPHPSLHTVPLMALSPMSVVVRADSDTDDATNTKIQELDDVSSQTNLLSPEHKHDTETVSLDDSAESCSDKNSTRMLRFGVAQNATNDNCIDSVIDSNKVSDAGVSEYKQEEGNEMAEDMQKPEDAGKLLVPKKQRQTRSSKIKD